MGALLTQIEAENNATIRETRIHSHMHNTDEASATLIVDSSLVQSRPYTGKQRKNPNLLVSVSASKKDEERFTDQTTFVSVQQPCQHWDVHTCNEAQHQSVTIGLDETRNHSPEYPTNHVNSCTWKNIIYTERYTSWDDALNFRMV